MQGSDCTGATPYPSRITNWYGGGRHHPYRHRLRFPRRRPVSRFRPPLASSLPPAELKARSHGGMRLAWIDPKQQGESAQASSLSGCHHPLSAPGRVAHFAKPGIPNFDMACAVNRPWCCIPAQPSVAGRSKSCDRSLDDRSFLTPSGQEGSPSAFRIVKELGVF
jgi:hypothetical protein